MTADLPTTTLEQTQDALLLTDGELLDLAREMSALPLDGPFEQLDALAGQVRTAYGFPDAGRHGRRTIAGSPQDQAVPDGVQNPYWEIVRLLPCDVSFSGSRLEPDGHWARFGSAALSRAYSAGLDRTSLCRRFTWSIPSPGDIAWIAKHATGGGIVEIGAGSGYWAWQLRQAGLDVAAYDPHRPGANNGYVKHGPYTEVRQGDHTAVDRHEGRALLLCWPTMATWAAQTLQRYKGDLLIYIGEDVGGCTADDQFFELRDREFEYVDESPFHETYWGIHCRLTAWRRCAARGAAL